MTNMKKLHFFLLGIVSSALVATAILFFANAIILNRQSNNMQDLSDMIFEQSPEDSLKQAAVYDKGLQMLRGTYAIPKDWLLQQDIYSSPMYGGSLQRMMLSFRGENGELIRVEQHAGSYPIGKAEDFRKFGEELEKIYQQGFRGILDEYQLENTTASKPSGISYLDTYVRTDSLYQYLETRVSGKREGKAYEGIIRIVYLSFADDRGEMVHTYLTLSPKGRLEQTLQTEEHIAYSYEANPAFDQYVLMLYRQYSDYMGRYTQPYDPKKKHTDLMKMLSRKDNY
jgi:hypothetical protein